MADAISNNSANSAANTKSGNDQKSLIATTDQFLTILLAQLKHQDPLEPMKGTEFIDSITRLASVEQDINQNKNLENIAALLGGGQINYGSPVSYLGKEVEVSSEQINLTDGMASFAYYLDEVPEQVSLIIRNQQGKLVLTADGSKTVGKNNINWDGSDSNGNYLPDGIYTVEVSAKTKESEASYAIESFTSGKVTEAGFAGDEMFIVVGKGVQTTLDKVVRVRDNNEVANNNEEAGSGDS